MWFRKKKREMVGIKNLIGGLCPYLCEDGSCFRGWSKGYKDLIIIMGGCTDRMYMDVCKSNALESGRENVCTELPELNLWEILTVEELHKAIESLPEDVIERAMSRTW